MTSILIGPITRIDLRFSYPLFDGKAVTVSFSYASLDQARYARDREQGVRTETMEAFHEAVGTLH